jgi:uncharacterized protein (TIGR00290 family)
MISACSWSGGKDCAIALQRKVAGGADVRYAITMLDESGERSRSHGLPLQLLEAQANALRLRLITRAASWADYTAGFEDALAEAAAHGCGECIFGDIDIDDHRAWCRQVAEAAGLEASHPLWQEDRRALVEEIVDTGVRAIVSVVRLTALDPGFLGRRITRELVDELLAAGADVCGENGEYHTVVTDGPLFREPVELVSSGVYRVGDCAALALRPAGRGGPSTLP